MLQSVYKKISAGGNVVPEGVLIYGKGREDFRVANVQNPFLGSFSVNQDALAFKINIRRLQGT